MKNESLIDYIDQYTNTVFITGTLAMSPTYSHQLRGVPYYSLRLSVRRSDSFSDGKDIIHIFVPENLLSEYLMQPNSMIPGISRFSVVGYLIQSELHGLADITVAAESFQSAETSEDFNLVYLVGTLHSTYVKDYLEAKDSRYLRLLVNYMFPKGSMNTRIVMSALARGSIATRIINDFSLGDTVMIRGHLESAPKESPRHPGSTIDLHRIDISIILRYNDTDRE